MKQIIFSALFLFLLNAYANAWNMQRFAIGWTKDNIIYDIGLSGKSKSGFGHPKCLGKEEKIAKNLAKTSVEK